MTGWNPNSAIYCSLTDYPKGKEKNWAHIRPSVNVNSLSIHSKSFTTLHFGGTSRQCIMMANIAPLCVSSLFLWIHHWEKSESLSPSATTIINCSIMGKKLQHNDL